MYDDGITHLCWLDLETTGLDPSTGEILQVAAIITDLQGNIVSEPYDSLVKTDVACARELSNEYVLNMHTETGLWERLEAGEGKTLNEVATDLLTLAYKFSPDRNTMSFAGNSVRFDMNWIQEHMPGFYSHLHYRNVDVTGVEATMRRFGIAVPQIEFVGDKHNALDDIRHAIKQYVQIGSTVQEAKAK